MSNDSPASVIGNKFVLEYYSTLSKNPELISKYYTADSVMSRGQASFEDEKQNSIQSSSALEGIQNAINTTNFKNCNFNLSGINCQKSFNRGVLLVVHGNVALKDQNHPRQFMQTFFLAPQTEPLYSYYVLNDIFNFIVTAPPPAATTTVTVSPKVVEEVHTPVQQQAANNAPVPVAHNNNNNNNASNGTHHAANASPIPAPTTVQVTVVHPTTTTTTPAAATTTTLASNNVAPANTTTATAASSSPIPPPTTTTPATTTTTTTTTTAAVPANNNNNNNKGSTKDKQKNANASNGTGKASGNKQQQQQQQPQAVEPTKPRSPSWANVVNIGNSNGVQPNQIPLPSTPPLIKNKASRSNSASGGSSSTTSSTQNGRSGFKKGDKEKLVGAKHERSIYVGNLPFSCKEDEVYENFKGFGQIYEIVLKDSGYCFVQYYAPDSASKALAFKERIIIGGRDLTIEPRKADSDRPKKNKQKAQQ